MVRVRWSKVALLNIRDLGAYIAESNPVAARQITRRLFEAGNSLTNQPNRGRPVAEGVRELVTIQPYIIRYEVNQDKVTILSVRHSRRRPLPA